MPTFTSTCRCRLLGFCDICSLLVPPLTFLSRWSSSRCSTHWCWTGCHNFTKRRNIKPGGSWHSGVIQLILLISHFAESKLCIRTVHSQPPHWLRQIYPLRDLVSNQPSCLLPDPRPNQNSLWSVPPEVTQSFTSPLDSRFLPPVSSLEPQVLFPTAHPLYLNAYGCLKHAPSRIICLPHKFPSLLFSHFS